MHAVAIRSGHLSGESRPSADAALPSIADRRLSDCANFDAIQFFELGRLRYLNAAQRR